MGSLHNLAKTATLLAVLHMAGTYEVATSRNGKRRRPSLSAILGAF
jgi:hypothetical protein